MIISWYFRQFNYLKGVGLYRRHKLPPKFARRLKKGKSVRDLTFITQIIFAQLADRST